TSFSRQTPGERYFTAPPASVGDAEPLPGLAAVLGQVLEPGDLAFAFDPGRVALGERRDQAADPVSDLQREVGDDGAGEGADVLRRQLLGAAEQLGVLGLAHSAPISASSASSFASACCFTSIASWSPITQTWL